MADEKARGQGAGLGRGKRFVEKAIPWGFALSVKTRAKDEAGSETGSASRRPRLLFAADRKKAAGYERIGTALETYSRPDLGEQKEVAGKLESSVHTFQQHNKSSIRASLKTSCNIRPNMI